VAGGASFGSTAFDEPGFCSCTSGGIQRLLDAYSVRLAGRGAVVVGCSANLAVDVSEARTPPSHVARSVVTKRDNAITQ
jgi:hypothetical protein